MGSKKLIYLLLLSLILTGCKEKTYTVTFNTLGGNVMESITLIEGEKIEEIEEPTKDGYLFVNWVKDGVEYDLKEPVTEDITLTASWIETPEIYDYYKVTFVMEGKTEKFVVKENETIEPLTAPSKENYTFIGWFVGEEKFDFNTKITKDIALVAKYESNTVTVTYELDGGLGLAFETVERHTTITIPLPPTKIGYKFVKWTLNGKEFSFDNKITEDITLKAVWQLIEYATISFDTDGGNLINDMTIEKYSKINKLPTPQKDGYIFKEWQLNNETFNNDMTIEDNITLTAVYEQKTKPETQLEGGQ